MADNIEVLISGRLDPDIKKKIEAEQASMANNIA